MRAIIVVALLAFVAVQVCHSAPRPDEDKKQPPPSAPEVVAPAAPVVAVAEVVRVESVSTTPPVVDTTVPKEEAVKTPVTEEKKEQ